MKTSFLFILVLWLTLSVVGEDRAVSTYCDTPKSFAGAQAFRDVNSGRLFYVESDGRHVAAIDEKGKLLWCRDPFVDAKLEPYRVQTPVIVTICSPLPWMVESRKGNFVYVGFNSSQMLILDVKTGDPTWVGQD